MEATRVRMIATQSAVTVTIVLVVLLILIIIRILILIIIIIINNVSKAIINPPPMFDG